MLQKFQEKFPINPAIPRDLEFLRQNDGLNEIFDFTTFLSLILSCYRFNIFIFHGAQFLIVFSSELEAI